MNIGEKLRRYLPKTPAELACKKCGLKNELPFLFCEECGSPRVKLGAVRVTANISLAVAAFLGHFYLTREANLISWPWTLYTLFAIFYVQICLLFVGQSISHSARLLIWMGCFFAGGAMLAEAYNTEGLNFLVILARDLPQIAKDSPVEFYGYLGGGLALFFLPIYFRWVRVFGWVNSYRIVLLSLFSLTVGIVAIFQSVLLMQRSGLFPNMQAALDNFATNVEPKYHSILLIVAVFLLRIFVIEIFVFAAVKGFAKTRKTKMAVDQKQAASETGFTRSILVLANGLRKFGYSMEQMLRYLVDTMRRLAYDLAKVIAAFFREIFVPVVALGGATLLMYLLAQTAVHYIGTNSPRDIAAMVAMLCGLATSEFLFLGTKARFRWKRLASVHGQVMGWLLPNVLVFFVLISLSLWATALVLNDESHGLIFPFRVGILTQVVLGLLVLVTIVIFARKSHLLTAPAEEEEVPEPATGIEKEVMAELGDLAEDFSTGEEDEAPPEKWSGTVRKKKWDLGKRTIVRSKREQNLLDKIAGKASAALGGEFKTQTERAVAGVRQRLEKVPEPVIRMQKTQEELDEKVRQLGALEASRDSISEDTFGPLQERYRGEIAAIHGRMKLLEKEIHGLYRKSADESRELEEKIRKLVPKIGDMNRLATTGAVDKKEHGKKLRALETEKKGYETRLAQCRQNMAVLERYMNSSAVGNAR